MKKMIHLFAVLIAFVMACGACVYVEEQAETTGINYFIPVSQQADIQRARRTSQDRNISPGIFATSILLT